MIGQDTPAIVLRVICAWCTRVLIAGTPGAPVSHGICEACEAVITAEEED